MRETCRAARPASSLLALGIRGQGAPNVRGQKPFVMKSFEAAEKWCRERGKRVCTEQEWELGCEGPEQSRGGLAVRA